jgi:hypothetical protein
MIPFLLAAVGGYLIADSMKESQKMAKGGKIGVDKASNGFKKKFIWIKEQNGFATEILQQKTFEEDFEEVSNNSRFRLTRDDEGLKIFTDASGWKIAYRLKPIFAYGGQLELDFEPEEEIDESTLKARRYVELQNLANEEIELFGEVEDDTAKEIEELGDSLNSHEVELVMEMYGKKFANGGSFDDSGDFKLSYYNPKIHDEEVKLLSFGSDYAEIQFDVNYADNTMVSYLLVYDVDKSEYDWGLEKAYKISNGQMVKEFLHWSPELKAIKDNAYITEIVDEIIGDAIEDDDDYEEYETSACPSCSGSGEGMYDGSTCHSCGGRGEI